MSVTSSRSTGSEDAVVTCRCKRPAKVETSRTAKNPGRKFYCCPYSVCNFFLWVDTAQKQLNVVSSSHFGEFAGNCLSRVVELEGKFSELEKKMDDFEDMKISYGKKLICICWLIVLLLFVIMFLLLQSC